MLTTLAVENYRSLRKPRVPLGRLNVVTGPWGMVPHPTAAAGAQRARDQPASGPAHPLGRLVARAAEDTQLVVSHSDELIGVIDEYADDATMIELLEQEGVTTVAGQETADEPPWSWQDR
ncbi:hypothetical protein [Nocardia sp. NPDC004860]|uniref:hypothetical protein n=1 Tax=Nocardia sp. NPDC004860 TaxID=3154557 RepID=UPI0033AD609C